MIIIDAFFIRSGGGLFYLDLFKRILKDEDVFILTNNRDLEAQYDNVIIAHNLLAREFKLLRLKPKKVINICNVPYFIFRGDIALFLQQRHYIDPKGPHFFTLAPRVKVHLKRLYFRLGLWFNQSLLIVVQTKAMKSLLAKHFSRESSVAHLLELRKNKLVLKKSEQVVLIYDLMAHKKVDWNHPVWEWFKSRGVKILIVNGAGLLDSQSGFELYPYLEESELEKILKESKYFITYTKFESLGLPLIHAGINDCIVFSHHLDVVDEILNDHVDLDQEVGEYDTIIENYKLGLNEEFMSTSNRSLFDKWCRKQTG